MADVCFQAILLHKNKNLPYFFQNLNLDEMKILLYNMGMEIVKKIDDTCIFTLKQYLLSCQKYNRPMQARRYTEDLEKILFQAAYHPTLGL